MNRGQRRKRNRVVLSAGSAPPEDIERAKGIGHTECPRRYCWWWRSLSFEWNLPVKNGCTFLEVRKPPDWPNGDLPCRRCNSSSVADHYEPREPHLMEDGFEETDWLV